MTTRTQTATLSVTAARRRRLSLSLLGRRTPTLLHDLPAEIILSILELALLHDRPRDLALISRIINQFVNIIVYRTVVLDSAHSVALLHRTASSPRSSYLLSHVKRLAITWEPEYFTLSIEQQLRQIVAGCTSMRTLAAPSCSYISTSPSVSLPQEGPTDLVVQSSFEDFCTCDPSSTVPVLPAYFSTSLTHLRICEPSNTWYSPLSIIAALNQAPNLTHLQLARRADSNEDNDVAFAEEIAYLLATRKALKMVAVGIFGGLLRASRACVHESSIWMLVSRMGEMDARVVVFEGKLGEWRNEWKDSKGLRCGGHMVDFWAVVGRRQPSDGKMEIEA